MVSFGHSSDGGMSEMRFALSVPESAKALGIGLSKMAELIADGEVASFKIGRRRLIRPLALEDYVRAREAEAMEERRQWTPWAAEQPMRRGRS